MKPEMASVLLEVDVIACQVHRHRVPAEGYTWSHQEPYIKAGKVSPASTAVTIIGKKALQNGSFPGGRSAGGI
jgi:hypothetical protein